MSNTYIDFETANNSNDDMPCVLDANFSRALPTNYDRLSIQKLNISVSDMFFMSVPLKQPQEYFATKQDDGYFETIYKIKFIYVEGNTKKVIEEPVYFYNYEKADFNYNTIGHDIVATGIIYDNRNDYFKINKLNTLLKCFNETIKEVLQAIFPNATGDFIKVMPYFATKNDVLNCYVISTYENSTTDMQQVFNPVEMDGQAADGEERAFCMGLSKNIGDMIYRPFDTITQGEYIFLQETEIMDHLQIDINTTPQTFYIHKYENKDYFEYMCDIKEILIRGSSLNVIPRLKTQNIPSKYLNNPTQQYILAEGIIHSFDIAHDREKISVIHYSNPNTNDNYSTLNSGSISSVRLDVLYVDKYKNIYELMLNPNEYAKIVVILFR